MKKIWIGLLVCVVTLCGVLSFSACGKKDEYNFSNLKSSYENVATNCTAVAISGGEIEISYAAYKYNDISFFEQVVNSTEPYTRLIDFYNPLFQNSMSFAYKYMDICSKQTIKVDKQTKEQLDQDLSALKSEIKNLDDHIKTLSERVRVAYSTDKNYNSIICSEKYISLFDQYDVTISAALNFSYDLAKIYFEKVLSSASVDYSQISLKAFDANLAVLNLKSKVDYQILNLTRAYFNTYVRGDALTTVFATKTSSGFVKPDSNFNDYLNSVSQISLNSEFENNLTTKMQVINQDADLKSEFYEKSIAMSNAQQIMDNDLRIYQIALNDVVYMDKKSDPNATDYEKICVQMIENHNYIVAEYNKILKNIIDLINNAGV